MIAFAIVITTCVLALMGISLKLAWDIQTERNRYIKLEEWAEGWLKRLEQKCEANTDQIAKLATKIVQMQDLLPKNGNGEVIRNQVLLQQMNDEMEKSIKMEREWNEGVAAILNYGKPIVRGDNE